MQIGARNMQNFKLLREVGKYNKPILLKRGLSSTIEEWLMAAEYIMSEGNEQVILCERGIRTFEPSTRNTFDVSAVPVTKELSHLPIIADPSHAAGTYKYVPALAKGAIAAGADGLMIEVHNCPEKAMSDGERPSHRIVLRADARAEPIAEAVGRYLGRLSGAVRDVSHMAAQKYTEGREELLEFATIYALILGVEKGRVERAIVPIENSIEGSVNITLDTLAFDVDLFITGEYVLKITENLIVKPGICREQIKKIVSHPQPIGQCSKMLNNDFSGIEIGFTDSTAKAAEMVSARGRQRGYDRPQKLCRVVWAFGIGAGLRR